MAIIRHSFWGINMKNMAFLALLAAAATTPALAADGDGQGFYVQLRGGYQGIQSPKGTFFDEAGTFGGSEVADAVIPTGSDTVGVKFHAKGGATIGADLGYDFGPVRAELGLTYGRNKLNGITIRSINGAAPSGLTDADAQDFCDYLAGGEEGPTCTIKNGNDVSSGGSFAKLRQIGAMASLWYDIPTGLPIEPYVGAGIGAVGYHVETADDGDGKVRFAWQIGGGVAYKLNSHIALTVDYRYRQVKGATLFAEDGAGLALGSLHTSLLSGGVRFTF